MCNGCCTYESMCTCVYVYFVSLVTGLTNPVYSWVYIWTSSQCSA